MTRDLPGLGVIGTDDLRCRAGSSGTFQPQEVDALAAAVERTRTDTPAVDAVGHDGVPSRANIGEGR
jgi:hypothetical protein